MQRWFTIALLAGGLASGPAWPHGATRGKDAQAKISAEEHPFGRQGDPKRVSRTVRIDMADTMRYSPAQITVKRWETVGFEVNNAGKVIVK
jgi:hypothetical protein